MKLYPVVLAGGKGSRLWPLSRPEMPKQFLSINHSLSFFQQTIKRTSDFDRYMPPMVIANKAHQPIIREQLRQIETVPFIVAFEPVACNTAMASVIAALALKEQDPSAIMVLMPSDHVIEKEDAFHRAVSDAIPAAKSGYIVTFGIKPDCANTNFAYIKPGDLLSENVFEVMRFVEKPVLGVAQNYLHSEEYLWNSGIFVVSVETILTKTKRFRPDVYDAALSAFKNVRINDNYLGFEETSYVSPRNESIDVAVMERTDNIAVIPVDFGWSDMGTWSAICDFVNKACNEYVNRPWGRYLSALKDNGLQCKHIIVKPRGSLSLQKHNHRSEHWIIVKGTAKVTLEDSVFDLHPDQSVHIPIGALHRLENKGSETLELIEVQIGDYLEEDDIIRYNDVYGRITVNA